MKRNLIKGLVFAALTLTAILTVTVTSVSAKSVFEDYVIQPLSETYDLEEGISIENMLNEAIQYEYLIQAQYQVAIETFGELRPFIRIIESSDTHISMLVTLFETYGFELPENNAKEGVIVPESITSAIATAIETEKASAAMYEFFLTQENLPEDVKEAFEYLSLSSEQHLNALAKERFSYYGEDMKNQIRNRFKNMFSYGNGSENQSGQRSNGNQQSKLSQFFNNFRSNQ